MLVNVFTMLVNVFTTLVNVFTTQANVLCLRNQVINTNAFTNLSPFDTVTQPHSLFDCHTALDSSENYFILIVTLVKFPKADSISLKWSCFSGSLTYIDYIMGHSSSGFLVRTDDITVKVLKAFPNG